MIFVYGGKDQIEVDFSILSQGENGIIWVGSYKSHSRTTSGY